MEIIKRMKKKRVLVIGLDGFPHSLISSMCEEGKLPFLSNLFKNHPPTQMKSVIPTISSVAWATYMTGKNPGNHNIFGFLDRSCSPFRLRLPNRSSLNGTTIWNKLNQSGHRVLVMNVPVTYPPEPVKGILVGGFLGVDVQKIAYPQSISAYLIDKEYIIDAEPPDSGAQSTQFLDQLICVLEKRCSCFQDLMQDEPWDFAQLHIMETDRLFHFLWSFIQSTDPAHQIITQKIDRFFRKMDQWIEQISSNLNGLDELILLSDHGFCQAEWEVQINTILEQNGFLKWTSGPGSGLHRIAPDSKAYSLIPGRIFINLIGREPEGSVSPSEYENNRQALRDLFNNYRVIIPGRQESQQFIRQVYFREELYHGSSLHNAADLVLQPSPGFELKGKLAPEKEIQSSKLQGMHTYDDAFLWIRNRRIREDKLNIIDLYPSILSMFGERDLESEGKIIIDE